MTTKKRRPRFCRHCGAPFDAEGPFCRQCGRQVEAVGSRAAGRPSPARAAAAQPPPPRRPEAQGRSVWRRWPLLAVGLAGAVICVAGAGLAVALWLDRPPRPGPASTAWENATSQPILSETLNPSNDDQIVDVEGAMTVVLPGGLLDAPQELTVATVAGGPELELPLPTQHLGTFEITLGDTAFFADHLFIALPYDPAELASPLAPEFSLVASTWDEAVGDWIEMPTFVDTGRQRLVIPTLHLTKIRYDCVVAEGHLYNDTFSIKYDPEELNALKSKYYPNFEDVLSGYPDGIFNALNDARTTYARHGFRDLEKIKAVETRIVEEWQRYGGQRSSSETTVRRYNVYIMGDRQDSSWSWNGIFYSNLKRSKYTGKITIPYDYSGVQGLEVAHEVFHSIQNRYYNLVGMTEFGIPGTRTPAYQFLARQWWLEATAEYAAGKLVYPEANGEPNRGMGGDIDPKRLEKALAHSPSAFVSGSERPAYNNAWFVEFLVSEKGVDFVEMFETVASYHWPSVYDNLVAYLESKGLDINQVYTEYALWWFFDPRSPLQRGAQSGRVPETALAGSYRKAPGEDVKDWHFEGGEGAHRAKIWEIRTGGGSGASASSTSPRALIVSLEEELVQSVRVDPPARSLWVVRGAPPAARQLRPEDPVVVETLRGDEPLYLLAVRNDDSSGGTLGQWHPDVRVTEATLAIEPEELQTFRVTARKIPDALTERLHLESEVAGQPRRVSLTDPLENVRGTVTVSFADERFRPGENALVVRLYVDGDVLLAEQDYAPTVDAPTAIPPADEERALRPTQCVCSDGQPLMYDPELLRLIDGYVMHVDGWLQSTGGEGWCYYDCLEACGCDRLDLDLSCSFECIIGDVD